MYLIWQTKTIADFSDGNTNALYSDGFLFGRTGRGEMYQTRSLRVDLCKFKLNSENKRILKKTAGLELKTAPIPYHGYHWSIHKMGKDFYDSKFGDKTFSANKIKELMTDEKKSNFNLLFIYNYVNIVILSEATERSDGAKSKNPLINLNKGNKGSLRSSLTISGDGLGRDDTVGYCVAYHTPKFLHYSYPFYDLNNSPKDAGLGMMTRAIQWAKENGKKYVYLGSASRPTDIYKLRFDGLEWFNKNEWEDNLENLKRILIQS